MSAPSLLVDTAFEARQGTEVTFRTHQTCRNRRGQIPRHRPLGGRTMPSPRCNLGRPRCNLGPGVCTHLVDLHRRGANIALLLAVARESPNVPRWAVPERPLQGRRPGTGGCRRVDLDNPGQAGIERRTKAQPQSPEFHGHTSSDVEAAEGIARGIGPSGAEHSPAQGATLGNRRPPARSHKCTNSRDVYKLQPPAASCRGLILCGRSAPNGRQARSADTALAPGSLLPGVR